MCSFLRVHRNLVHHLTSNEQLMIPRRMSYGILNAKSLKTLKEKVTINYPFAFIFYNTKPVGHQVVKYSLLSALLATSQKFRLLTLS